MYLYAYACGKVVQIFMCLDPLLDEMLLFLQ